MKVNQKTGSSSGGARVYLLDEIRGFAIICMVIYHTMFQLKYNFGVNVPVFFESWFDIIRDIFAGAFVFISGIMCRYSRDNVRRGARCFFLGMIITFVMPFVGGGILNFGILHLLGVSMMLYGLFEKPLEKIPPFIGLIVAAVAAMFTWNVEYGYFGFGSLRWDIPQNIGESGMLFPLGIVSKKYYSSDFFPLMPWFFIFLAGGFVGYWFKNGSMPQMFYNSHCKWLQAVGRATLLIYLIHLPLIVGILTLILR